MAEKKEAGKNDPALILDREMYGKKAGDEIAPDEPGWNERHVLLGMKAAHWQYRTEPTGAGGLP